MVQRCRNTKRQAIEHRKAVIRLDYFLAERLQRGTHPVAPRRRQSHRQYRRVQQCRHGRLPVYQRRRNTSRVLKTKTPSINVGEGMQQTASVGADFVGTTKCHGDEQTPVQTKANDKQTSLAEIGIPCPRSSRLWIFLFSWKRKRK